MIRRWAVATSVVLVLVACEASNLPPVVLITDAGVIRAGSYEQAVWLQNVLAQQSACISSRLPLVRHITPEVCMATVLTDEDRSRTEHAGGMSYADSGRIILDDDALPLLEVVLAHELTHVLQPESWMTLPSLVNEGLCDVLASKCAQSGQDTLVATRLLGALQR